MFHGLILVFIRYKNLFKLLEIALVMVAESGEDLNFYNPAKVPELIVLNKVTMF